MNVLIFWVCHTNTQQLTTWADTSPHYHSMMFFGLIQLIALQKSSEFLIEKQTYKCNKLTSATNLQVQQTPKPLAQEPAEVPPLLVHSELENI